MLARDLGISRKNLLRSFASSKLFQNQIHRNPGSLKARFPKHHVGADFDVLRNIHYPTLAGPRVYDEDGVTAISVSLSAAWHLRANFGFGRFRSRVRRAIDFAYFVFPSVLRWIFLFQATQCC